MDVARYGRLGGLEPAPGERGGDVLLSVSGAAIHELEDGLVALVLARLRLPAHAVAPFMADSIAAWARSISSAVMISGGTKRTVWSSTALTTRPASRQACWNGFAFGSSNCTARIRPSPRDSWAPRP